MFVKELLWFTVSQSDSQPADPWCHIFPLNNWSDALDCLNWAPVAEVKQFIDRWNLKGLTTNSPRGAILSLKVSRLCHKFIKCLYQNTTPSTTLVILLVDSHPTPTGKIHPADEMCWLKGKNVRPWRWDRCSSNTEIKAHLSAYPSQKRQLPAARDVTMHHGCTWLVRTCTAGQIIHKLDKTWGMSWDHEQQEEAVISESVPAWPKCLSMWRRSGCVWSTDWCFNNSV